MDIRAEALAADHRIDGHVRRTPVEPSPFLSELSGARVHLKLENLQRTGSFKFRGAMNKLLSLSPEERGRGVVAASTGNHGAAVACGAAAVGCPAVVFAPEHAAPSKLAAIADHGAEVVREGDDCLVAEHAAREHARERDLAYISPYNDPAIVAGQGTVGVELERDLDGLDAVFVAVGGGGLISGTGGFLKGAGRDVRVVGCSPENSAVMHASLEAGRILDLESKPTLSDGTAGGVEEGSITFDLCRDVIDDFVLVTEDEIRDAVRTIVGRHHVLIEGAAGVAVAAFLRSRERFEGQDVAIVLCGANIDPEVLKGIL